MPYTLDQLEAYVSSPRYDAAIAGLLALDIPALKATGAPGELIEPGVRRIRGNLCNVHGRYGPCDKAAGGKKKPAKGKKPPKPKKTEAQRAQESAANQAARQEETTREQALNMTKVGEATGLEDHLANLDQFSQGKPIRPQDEETLIAQGLMERGTDGAARVSEQGRVLISAAKRGDVQRARDAMSRGRDRVSAGADRAKRQQDAAGKRTAAQVARELAKREREAAAKKKPAKAGAGGSKKPSPQAAEKPLRPMPKPAKPRGSSGGVPAGPSASGFSGSAPKPKPAEAKPDVPAKQVAPALQDAAAKLSDGAALSEEDAQALIRNGLAKVDKNGVLVLTAAGIRATQKTFRVFKDATGRHRWVAQSSTAFQDRDKEIVSTKALSDDCAFADQTGAYGPLRWWHTPGLDLGDCDFNAMHGRVLIESGTFRSAAIAQKVARAAAGLEISLGFIHLPTEPDADGVFHHIRRFERSLVPRGKASNRFTAFAVKENTRMFDPTKIAALKTLGFGDDDIAALQAQAAATEKSATDQGVAFKADEPELPDLVINGVTYKAFPPPKADEAEEEIIETDAVEEMMVEDVAEAAPTIDLEAIRQIVAEVVEGAVAQIMGGLDLEKKVAGHVQGLLAPHQQAQATKDAALSETKEQLETVKAQLAELTGNQPATPYRPSAAKDNVLTDATMLAAAKQLADPHGADPWADIKQGLGIARTQ